MISPLVRVFAAAVIIWAVFVTVVVVEIASQPDIEIPKTNHP